VFQKARRPVCLRHITLLDHTTLLESNHFFEKHVRVSPFTSRTGLIGIDVLIEMLTLILQPGLSYPQGNVIVAPALDMVADPIQISVPIYPEAMPTARTLVRPFLPYPRTPYLKSAVAQFCVPADCERVSNWCQTSFGVCGYELRGATTANANVEECRSGAYTGLSFVYKTDRQLSVTVALERIELHCTLVLYVAQKQV